MEGIDNMDFDMMLSYALATENDAITMYRFMLRNCPEDMKEPLYHILKEEKEHALMLKQMISGEDVDLDH